MSKKSIEKLNQLQEQLGEIEDNHQEIDVNKYLAKIEDLPDLGDIQIYDYDADMESSMKIAKEVIESLGDFYLGDVGDLIKHKYIQNKIKEDAMVYAETIFLNKMTRKNFVTQMRQVDNGDANARMHEVMNQTVGQIRENIKFAATQRTELEKFYNSIKEQAKLEGLVSDTELEDTKEEGKVIDTKNLNDMMHNILKKQNENKKG